MELGEPRFWAFAAIVAFAFSVEATVGFGATLIAVSLGVHLFPLGTLLPVFVPLGLVLSGTLALRGRAFVDRRLLLTRILPWMVAGLAIGQVIFESASHEILRHVFGGFVVALAVLELSRLARGVEPDPAITPRAATPALLGAGVVHGMFSTGGPLLVWALGRSVTEKSSFRATLASVFVVLASLLTLSFAWNDRLGAHTLPATAALLPTLALALALGEWAHHRLDERRFRVLVYVLLLGAGLSSLI